MTSRESHYVSQSSDLGHAHDFQVDRHARTTWPIMLHFSFYTVKASHNDCFLFALAVSTAAVQLGLTAYLLAARASYNTLFVAFPPNFVYGLQLNHIVDPSFSCLTPFGPSCTPQHACCGIRKAVWICSPIYLAQFFGSSPPRFSGYGVIISTRCAFSEPSQGLSIGFVHNARARKSCGDVPFDI